MNNGVLKAIELYELDTLTGGWDELVPAIDLPLSLAFIINDTDVPIYVSYSRGAVHTKHDYVPSGQTRELLIQENSPQYQDLCLSAGLPVFVQTIGVAKTGRVVFIGYSYLGD